MNRNAALKRLYRAAIGEPAYPSNSWSEDATRDYHRLRSSEDEGDGEGGAARIGELLCESFQPSAWFRLVSAIKKEGFRDLDPRVIRRLVEIGHLMEDHTTGRRTPEPTRPEGADDEDWKVGDEVPDDPDARQLEDVEFACRTRADEVLAETGDHEAAEEWDRRAKTCRRAARRLRQSQGGEDRDE